MVALRAWPTEHWRTLGTAAIAGTALAILLFLLIPLFPPTVPSQPPSELTQTYTKHVLFEETVTAYPLQGEALPQPILGKENLSLGVAAENRTLNFGRIPVGAAVRKQLNVSAARRSRLRFVTAGNISEHIGVPRTRFVEGRQAITVRFAPHTPGMYKGTLVVESLIPRNAVGAAVLEVAP